MSSVNRESGGRQVNHISQVEKDGSRHLTPGQPSLSTVALSKAVPPTHIQMTNLLRYCTNYQQSALKPQAWKVSLRVLGEQKALKTLKNYKSRFFPSILALRRMTRHVCSLVYPRWALWSCLKVFRFSIVASRWHFQAFWECSLVVGSIHLSTFFMDGCDPRMVPIFGELTNY